MKKFVSKQKNCFIIILCLIVISEILLKINNKLIQSFGIFLLPVIIAFILLLIKNDIKNVNGSK